MSMDLWGAALCISAGLVWRLLPQLPSISTVRRIVGNLVFFFFLPALTFHSMATAPLGDLLWKIPSVAGVSILISALVAHGFLSRLHLQPPQRVGLQLAASWGNVTYLGIPVLATLLGTEQIFVAVLSDFAAATPLMWTFGVALAARIGKTDTIHWWKYLIRVPPLWAALAGLTARLFLEKSIPPQLDTALRILSWPVIPLMMFVLGLSLRWQLYQKWRTLVPVAVVKLIVAPAVALSAALALGIEGSTLHAVVLEAAMPTMMLTLVVSEMFRLDTELIAAAIAVTTLTAPITLFFWWWITSMLI